MKKFQYTIQADSRQEPLAVVEAVSQEAATNFFAAEKKLTTEDFLRIFSVSECPTKNK